jgi:hypothetical protein
VRLRFVFFGFDSLCYNPANMIRLPILKDELAFLEKHLPELETRPDLTQLAVEFKRRIDTIRQEIRALQEKTDSK